MRAARSATRGISALPEQNRTSAVVSYNQDLSERRAEAVVTALKQRSVTGALEAAGFGEGRPIAPNTKGGKDYPAGRQLNRRVEIVIPAGS